MGSILKNPTTKQKQYITTRQGKYFRERKTTRPRQVKREQNIQLELCDWMREVLPGVHFRSDTGSGAFSSNYEKQIHNRQQSSTSEPDLMIFAARHGYHGMLIELKSDKINLKMKRDGTKIRVYKDNKGKIIDRDYKIRLKDDWSNLHIERQALVLEDYRKNWGYLGVFAVGLEDAKKKICRYFDIPYVENSKLF